MAHSLVEPTAQLPREEIENEILRLRNTPGQNNLYFEESRPGRRITFDNQSTENMLLHELLQEIRELRIQVGSNRNEREPSEDKNRVSRNFHENALDLIYGRTHSDIRNQPGASISFLNLKEARNMIRDRRHVSESRTRIFKLMQLRNEEHTFCERASLTRSRYLYQVQGEGDDRFPHPHHCKLRAVKKRTRN